MDATQFVKQVGKLPSLPAVYHELSHAVESPNTSIDTITGIARQDQSLTSRLLKLANSALYGFPSPVESLEQAVQVIGLREMRDLALATCVIGAFKDVPSHLVNVTDFWRHSVACGITSGLLATRRHDSRPERFFLGGLLHDIGRLLMYIKAPRESADILLRCETTDLPPCAVETAVLGFDHAELGAELLSVWRVPEALVEMVRRHHSPVPAHLGIGDEITVHCADFIATVMGWGGSGESDASPLAADAFKRCLIDEQQIEGLIAEAEERCERVFPILAGESHE